MRTRCALVLALLFAACRSDSAPSKTVATWTVDTLPVVEIAADDTLETIGNVAGVARLVSGRIAVADQSNSFIRMYDSTGKFIQNVGRKGSGPGEFEMLGGMLHCGDSLYAHDFSRGDFTLVASDGSFGRRVKIALPDSVRSTNSSVCNSVGQFLTAGWDAEAQGMEKSGPTRGPIPFWTSDASGTFVASLGSHQGPEKWLSVLPDGIIIVGPRPLGKETLIALGTTKAYVGTADSSVINVYKLDGTPEPPLKTASSSRRANAADIKFFKLQDTIALSRESREIWTSRMKEMKYPDVLPAYSALLVDNANHVWVRAFPRAGEPDVEWQVFAESGEPVATVRLPSTLRVAEIGAAYLAGIHSDPKTGRQRVVLMTLHRKAADQPPPP